MRLRSPSAVVSGLVVAWISAAAFAAGAAEKAAGDPDAPVAAPKPAVVPPIYSAHTTLDVRVDPQFIRSHACVEYEMLRGSADQVRVAVPAAERICAIVANGAVLPQWSAVTENDFRIVTVRLPSRAAERIVVELETEREAAGPALDFGGEAADQFVRPLDVRRSNGLVVLSSDGPWIILVDSTHGATQIAGERVAEQHRRPGACYFRFNRPQFRIGASLSSAAPHVQAKQSSRYDLSGSDLGLRAEFRFDVARAGVYELRFAWPEGLVLDGVQAEGLVAADVDDGRALSLSFNRARRGSVSVTLSAHGAWNATMDHAALPLIRPIDVQACGARLVLAAAPGERLEVHADDRGLVELAEPSETAMRYRDVPEQIRIRSVPERTEVAAHAATAVTIGRERADVSTTLRFDVESGTARTFRFLVPEEVSERVRISPAGGANQILEQHRSEADEAGWSIHTLVMNRAVTGEQRFRVDWDLPFDDAAGTAPEDAESHRIEIQPLRVLAPEQADGTGPILTSFRGEIAIAADAAWQLTAELAGPSTERIEPDDLASEEEPRARAAFRHGNEPAELTVGLTRTQLANPSGTLVGKGLVEVALSASGTADYLCRYELSGNARSLIVQLPEDAQPMGAWVGGIAAAMHREAADDLADGYEGYQVDLGPAGGTTDSTHAVAVQFRLALPDADLSGIRGATVLPLPQLDARGETSGVLEELRTCVWLPDQLAVVGSPRGFTRLSGNQRAADERWIGFGDIPGAFRPTGRASRFHAVGTPHAIQLACWNEQFATWLLSGAALLIAFVLRPTSWENRTTMLLTAGVAVALIALVLPAAVVAGLFAARWGAAAGAMIWVARAISARRQRDKPTGREASAPAAIPSVPSTSPLRSLRRGA